MCGRGQKRGIIQKKTLNIKDENKQYIFFKNKRQHLNKKKNYHKTTNGFKRK